MILGVAEAFNPLYFFTEIPKGSKGEVFVNYNRGMIVYSKIISKKIMELFLMICQIILIIINKKITFNSTSCNNEKCCEIYWIIC